MLKAQPRLQAESAGHVPHCSDKPAVEDNDKINGCKLAESMFLNLHGHIDDQLQYIIAIAADHIDKGETSSRLVNLEILINAVLINASAALHFIELEMEAVLIPGGLRGGWPGIVVDALNIFKTLPRALAST
ncbi:hypothetical protein AZE42_06686 [Rhizopogon vesiculosus]|uniref:Uncharacterized protein n=1 Tax=Rhizopogon vesiculosus TaxID=180088 RepID=A0A1J8PFK9_9AGAM|nr:hypothetical protein AZE42_06686 [Rhizopogon vesiculosus]